MNKVCDKFGSLWVRLAKGSIGAETLPEDAVEHLRKCERCQEELGDWAELAISVSGAGPVKSVDFDGVRRRIEADLDFWESSVVGRGSSSKVDVVHDADRYHVSLGRVGLGVVLPNAAAA